MYVMRGHNGRPVSGLSLQHDEMGFFSAGWDGSALVRLLNTLKLATLNSRGSVSNGTSIPASASVNSPLTGLSLQQLRFAPSSVSTTDTTGAHRRSDHNHYPLRLSSPLRPLPP